MSSPNQEAKEQMAEGLWDYLDGLVELWDYVPIMGAVEVWLEKTKEKLFKKIGGEK